MSDLLAGDLSGLTLPRDLGVLLAEANRAADAGASLEDLYVALAEQAPAALVELAIGPRALRQPAALHAALEVVDALEAAATPAGVYRRLIDLGGSVAALEEALDRHPDAPWLMPLCERAEAVPGACRLSRATDGPRYFPVCLEHARAGHVDALLAQASGGRPEPAAALLQAGHGPAAMRAAGAALAADPQAPVVAWMAAASGPGVGAVLTRLMSHLPSREAAEALLPTLAPFPEAHRLLRAVLPGLRAAPRP